MHKSCSPGAMAHSRRTGRFTVRRRPTTDMHGRVLVFNADCNGLANPN